MRDSSGLSALGAGAGAAAVAQGAEGVADAVGELGQGFELECGIGRGPLDVDDEELAARLADGVAEAGDVHPIAAVEGAEAEVEVPLHAQGPPAVEAEGVAGEF